MLTVGNTKWQLLAALAVVAFVSGCDDGKKYPALITTSQSQTGYGYNPGAPTGFVCPIGGTAQINGVPYVMIIEDQGTCQRMSQIPMGQAMWVQLTGDFLNGQGPQGGYQGGYYGQNYFRVRGIDFNYNGFGGFASELPPSTK